MRGEKRAVSGESQIGIRSFNGTSQQGDGTAVLFRIHILDAYALAGADAGAGELSIARVQRGEDLDDLTIDLERYDALAVGVETGHCGCFVGDRTFERLRRFRGEAHRKVPERRNEDALEQQTPGDCSREEDRPAEQRPQEHPGGTEAEEHTEDEAG